tara:strand:- start:2427 stop:2726 length:300 start_codon:yes stop_codon:yes gene_type:complete
MTPSIYNLPTFHPCCAQQVKSDRVHLTKGTKMFATIITTLATMIPSILIKIFAKVLTEDLLQGVLEKLAILCLEKAAKLTTNKVDDELVEMIAVQIKRH